MILTNVFGLYPLRFEGWYPCRVWLSPFSTTPFFTVLIIKLLHTLRWESETWSFQSLCLSSRMKVSTCLHTTVGSWNSCFLVVGIMEGWFSIPCLVLLCFSHDDSLFYLELPFLFSLPKALFPFKCFVFLSLCLALLYVSRMYVCTVSIHLRVFGPQLESVLNNSILPT